MSDTSGEDWLAMRLADVGKAWKEDVARLTSRIAELERAAETTRAEHAAAIKRAEEAEARVLDPTPYEGPATGDDLIDRLRGIYVSPLPDGERRFGSSRVNREAAAEIERLREWQSEADIAIKRPEPSEHAAALGLATARIRELEGELASYELSVRDGISTSEDPRYPISDITGRCEWCGAKGCRGCPYRQRAEANEARAIERTVPVLYVDLDGTVRQSKAGTFVNRAEDVELIPGALEQLKRHRLHGWRIIAVSNQGGIALGHLSADECVRAMKRTHELCDGIFDKITWCSHHPDAKDPEMARCWCRKPRPGGAIEAALALAAATGEIYPPHMALFVGDRAEDRDCANALNVTFLDAKEWREGAFWHQDPPPFRQPSR